MPNTPSSPESPPRQQPEPVQAVHAWPPVLRIIICGAPDSGENKLIKQLRHSGHATETSHAGPPTVGLICHVFRTSRRHFIFIDGSALPATAHHFADTCATADVVILMLDHVTGLDTGTLRHLQLVAALRVEHLVLVVNDCDMTAGDTHALVKALEEFVSPMGFTSIAWIPLLSTNGANIAYPQSGSDRQAGPTLLSYLEGLQISPGPADRPAFAVKALNYVNGQRLISGEALGGNMKSGDYLRLNRNGATTQLIDIITAEPPSHHVQQRRSVTLLTSPPLDAQVGDILSLADQPLESSDHFETTLIWTDKEPGLSGREYELRLANQRTNASITTVRSRLNVTNHTHEATRHLELNDIGKAQIVTETPVVFDKYDESKQLGRFILIDIQTDQPVATGLICHSLRRAQNIHRQALSITRRDRELITGHKGKVVWFTGLSGSGKSTLANALEVALHADRKCTYILDGDNIRQGLNKDLGFTDIDRVENIRRIAEVAKLMMDAGLIVLTAFISPFRREREMARTLIGAENFVEVFISTPLAICEARDPKGLYKKARSGQLPNMTGIGSPYEIPENAQITLDASCLDIADAVRQLKKALYEAPEANKSRQEDSDQ